MSEYQSQENLNARAAQNRETEERRANLALDAERVQQAIHQSVKRRRAIRRVLVNVLGALMLIIGLLFAFRGALISVQLAAPLMQLACVWAAIWIGAFLQHRFCKGGLLEWGK